MKGKSILWLMGISALSAVICVAGLGWTVLYHFGGIEASVPTAAAPVTPPRPNELPVMKPEDGSLRVVALGDSLAKGTGDASGKGFVGVVAEQWKDNPDKREVTVSNLAVNGLTSVQLAAQLERTEVQSEVKTADVLLLSIGGNDLFRSGETLVSLDLKKIQELEDEYNKQLHTILSKLRELNRDATIYHIGLYNPFIELKDAETTSRVVRAWNHRAAETAAAYPRTIAVPTSDLFQQKVQDYLSMDQFHPNALGYQRIGERLAALIKG